MALGVGLIGTGYMGKCHALAWNNVAAVFADVERPRLVGLAEVSRELAEKRAAEFGFARPTSDWRDLVGDPEIDVISITAPNALHPDMAISALQAGKHVWCEKPMAPAFTDAIAMRDAARKAGRIAVLGYNYIQNPLVRHMKRLIGEGAIGKVNHIRMEMDEDFMADAQAPFCWKNEESAGYGALDDFAVHPLSLLWMLSGHVVEVVADMGRPHADRPTGDGSRRNVENHDLASVLCRTADGPSAVLLANRAAWGRKGRIALQIFGSEGSILYDQERMNEFQLYDRQGRASEHGFKSILAAPHHAPYDRFIPAPGHGLGFNDLKTIECRELLAAIAGTTAHVVDFEVGCRIEETVHAMARSFFEKRWVGIA
jgi:predicted dehydrogenase